jgi:hypothetical protein
MEKQDNTLNQRNMEDNDKLHEDFLKNKNQSMMVSDKDDQSTSVSLSLQQQLERLQKENEYLKQTKDSLEIDNVCLEQKNKELKSRIDDFATYYPKASILLGKKPTNHQTNNKLKTILRREK